MIVIDSSALLAILLREPEGDGFERVVKGDELCLMSAVNAHETITVLRIRRGLSAVKTFWALIDDLQIQVVPFDQVQVHAAAAAFDNFGKGLHSRARLNLCDCAAYALAKLNSAPLLYKGDDFSHTDIVTAV